MSASPIPSTAKRFAPYIEELQEFFASSCLRYGSPEDIIELTERLESSPAFAEDMSSMIRSVVLREGGSLQHSQLLEILALSIGGGKMDQAPQHYSQPLRNLLSFMTGVLRKPWNEPPKPERGAVLPFPAHPERYAGIRRGQGSAIAAAAERSAHSDASLERTDTDGDDFHFDHFGNADPEAVLDDEPVDDSDPPWRLHVGDRVGDITPAPASAQDPETPADLAIDYEAMEDDAPFQSASADDEAIEEHVQPMEQSIQEPIEDSYAAEEEQHDQLDAAAIEAPQATPVEAPSSPAAAAVPLEPAPEPVPLPSGAPSWQVAANAVRGGQPDSGRKPPVRTLETPLTAPHPPAVKHAPSTEKPWSQLPYTPRLPRTAAGMLVTGAAILVVAGVFASLHRTPTQLIGKQVATPNPVDASVPPASAVTPAPQSTSVAKPSASTLALPVSPVRRRVADEDESEVGVAAPYSTPIPGQPATTQPATRPSAYGSGSQPQTTSAPPVPPSSDIATAASTPPPAPGPPANTFVSRPAPSESFRASESGAHTELRAAYRDPDASIVGDLPRRPSRGPLSDRPNFLDVSSGIMAGNLLDAPMPDYPRLAHIAHVGGEVVLQAVIAKNGSVLATHVLRGNRLLRGAAQDAVRQWRYRPYLVDGHPAEVATIVTVRFHADK